MKPSRWRDSILSLHASQVIDRAYEEGYAKFPETEEELLDAEQLAVDAIREETWEKW